MIPKKIHYCWFGGNPLPELATKCIDSWKKFCPDYEIIEWNESNFDINCCDYVREAYQAKKWAFVSDYARFKILYENGGLYFDTDVEMIKSFDDIILKGGFMGRESNRNMSVAPGLGLAVSPKSELYRELLETYHKIHFINADGTMNLNTVVDYTTEVLLKYGLKNTNEIQLIAGINIYPQEYFCPMNYDTGELTITANTYSIHHYTASWYGKKEEFAHQLKRKFIKFLPRKIAVILATSVAKIKYEGLLSWLKWALKKR